MLFGGLPGLLQQLSVYEAEHETLLLEAMGPALCCMEFGNLHFWSMCSIFRAASTSYGFVIQIRKAHVQRNKLTCHVHHGIFWMLQSKAVLIPRMHRRGVARTRIGSSTMH